MKLNRLYLRTFLILLVLVTLAFIRVLQPFYGAVFWGATLAIIFMPIRQKLTRSLQGRRNLAAFLTLLLVILIVLVPVAWTGSALVQEGMEIYKKIDSGDLRFGVYFAQIIDWMPSIVHDIIRNLGLGDVDSLREKLSSAAVEASRYATSTMVSFGQNTFGFIISLGVMLYLLFFLLRDGPQLAEKGRRLIPLSPKHQQLLMQKFATVIRATVKGNITVAAVQGALGGFIFWVLGIEGALLWAVVMGVLSLLPAVGASLIWGPTALYFFATGSIWQGVVLTAFGVIVIGFVDNLLRPLLVGKDTKLPDYVILISTLGGISAFGINGFVIGPLIAALFMACWDLLPSALNNDNEQ